MWQQTLALFRVESHEDTLHEMLENSWGISEAK